MPNLVPYDKFRPGNMEKAWNYLFHIARISPKWLKYGDKKSLKGKGSDGACSGNNYRSGSAQHLFNYWHMWDLYEIHACEVLNHGCHC